MRMSGQSAREMTTKLGGGAPKCPKCGKSVYHAEQVVGAGKTWHKRCFTCTSCNKSLDSTTITEHDSKVMCPFFFFLLLIIYVITWSEIPLCKLSPFYWANFWINWNTTDLLQSMLRIQLWPAYFWFCRRRCHGAYCVRTLTLSPNKYFTEIYMSDHQFQAKDS